MFCHVGKKMYLCTVNEGRTCGNGNDTQKHSLLTMEKWVKIETVREKGDAFTEGKRREISHDGAVMGSLLSDMLNDMGSSDKEEELLMYMLHDHPTLQQKFFGLALKAVRGFAAKETFDGRNKFSVESARKIVGFLDENGIGGCPHI